MASGPRLLAIIASAVSCFRQPLEESHSGLVGATGNRVCLKGHRGFESHLLRHVRHVCPASKCQDATETRTPLSMTTSSGHTFRREEPP